MAYYVYIIRSISDGSYYKGYTEYPALRLHDHNEGFSSYTSKKGPWQMVYLQLFETKREALIREKNLKKYSKERLDALIKSPINIVSSFNFR
ncbi:MAG: GIY-YIG nuclease family protein [Flavobacteriales bacterium]